jgi:hypothetical protein
MPPPPQKKTDISALKWDTKTTCALYTEDAIVPGFSVGGIDFFLQSYFKVTRCTRNRRLLIWGVGVAANVLNKQSLTMDGSPD